MKATVYRGIGDKHELIPFEAGKTIAECFDFDLSNAVILKNGLIANKDDILAEGDVLLIRDIPLAPVAIVAAIVAIPFVVLGTTALVGLVKDIQKAKQMQADAEKLSKSLKDEVKNIPYLRGAQNQIALGQTQPLILGQHLFTPYLATGTFSKIGGATGKDQFFHMVLQAGFAKTVIKELSCDDVVLKKWDTDEPQQGVYNFDSGIFYDDKNKIEVVQDGSPFTTAEFNKVIHTETPNTTIDKADSENYPAGGYVFTLPENTMAVELCILFRGLVCYASDGAKLKRTVKIYPEYKIGDGAWTRFTFNQNGTASNTFSYMSLEQMRFVARKEFSFNEVKDVSEPILVRLLCDTARYEGSARDDVSLLWIQSEKYDKEKSINNFVPEEIVGSTERALSNLVGLKIKVTESNQDKLNKINMVLQSVAKTWNGSTWSVNKEPTRNPASLLLEVLTSDTHKASQIKESEIDLDSFGELYEYCEEKGFKFDIVLTEGQTKQEVCEMILENCNAILYKSITGLMTVAIDKPKENAIALFNSQNILSIDNKKNIERKADGIKINYISRAGGYVNSSYLVMRDGQARTADSILIELNTQGMTEYEHIVKYARKLLASELLQPKQTIIEVGKEGIYYTPLSKVLLQHDSLKVGKGNAEVKSLIVDDYNVVGLKLYEPVEYDENETNGMIIVGAQNGAHVFYSLKYTALESFTDTVELVEPIPLSASNKPQQGDILSYGLIDGEFAKITTEMLIIGSEPTEDGHRLTLVDYNEAVYETGAIPAYEPSFTTSTNFEATKPVLDGTPPPPTMDELQEVYFGIVNGTADVGRPDQIENIRATAFRDGISFYCDILSDGLKNTFGRIDWEIKASGEQWSSARKLSTTVFTGTYNFDRVRDGYPEKDAVGLWEVRAKAVNGYGFESEFYSAVAVVNADGYGTWIQEKPTVFNVQSANRAVNMSWQRPVNNLGKEIYGLKYYEIQISKNGTNWYKPAVNKTGKDSESDWYNGTGQLRNDSANYTQSLPLTGQTLSKPENTTYYFRVRTVGETNTSSWSDTQTGIALATGIGDVVAKAIKTEQLANKAVTNRTIDDLAVDTDQLAIGAVVADRIASRTITAEQLSVVARSKVNSFIHESDGLTGWTTGGEIVTVDSERALKLSYPNHNFLSDPFDVQPDELLEFSFGLQCSRDAEGLQGLYIGLTEDDTYERFEYSWTDKKWNFLSVGTNAYFVNDYRSSTKRFFKTYILGYNIDITTVPSPQFTDESYNVRCLKLSSGKTQTRIRSGYNPIIKPTFWYLFSPQVYQVGAGKIVAQQIDVKNLSAMSSKLGEIQGDTADYKLVMGSGGSAEEGTFLLGSETDSAYLRRWKENGVWNMAIKLATFIVDAVSSKIKGVFEVQKTDGTPVFKMDPNSGKITAPTLVGNVTGNLTGNADTATAPLYQWIKTRGDLFRYVAEESPTTTYYWYKVCKITTAMTFDIEVVSDNNHARRSSYRLSVSTHKPTSYTAYTVALFNLGQADASRAKLAVALDADGYLYMQTNCIWVSSLHVTLLYSESNFSITMDRLGYAPFGTESGFTPVKIITQTGGFRVQNGVAGNEISPIINTNIIGNVTGNLTGNLTGTPKAPTPATSTNDTQIATTAFVKNQNYEPNRGTGTNALALGVEPVASGDYSIALGALSEASGDYSIALGVLSTASGLYSTALGANAEASGDNSTAIGLSSKASKINSLAIGLSSEASGDYSTALGEGSTSSGDHSTALGEGSTSSGNYSIAIGYNAAATRDYQISIGNKFVYLRFPSTTTEATVYNALSPWVNPTNESSQGAMGSYGDTEVILLRRAYKTASDYGIRLYNITDTNIKYISSSNNTQIGSNLAICTVMY